MDLTLDEALKRGIEAHQSGRLEEADRYYTAILQADPRQKSAS